jgi:hypothetical protein
MEAPMSERETSKPNPGCVVAVVGFQLIVILVAVGLLASDYLHTCGSYADVGAFLVAFLGYVMLWVILAFVLLVSWRRRLGTMLGTGGKLVLWTIPQVLAFAVYLCWAYTSGAMDNGSTIGVGPLALVMLVGMVGGWALVSEAAEGRKRAPDAAEPPPPE